MTKANEPLWIATAAAADADTFEAGLHVDTAVIGAGISGLTAAMLLTSRGQRVAIVEKERVGAGESGHTTAHVTEAVDARYAFLTRSFSQEVARQVARVSRGAIEQIGAFVADHRIDCHFRRVPGYLYTEKRSDVAALKREAAAASDAGVGAKFVEEVPLPFPTRGAVLFQNQAQFHPIEYLTAMAAALRGKGCRIFERTHVTSVTKGKPCVIETSRGGITADAVVMATNVPIEGFVTLFVKDAAYRTYAMAFEAGGSHPDGLFWDTADPYHYTRWQETDAGSFLIVGGEDHKVGAEQDTEACFARLQQYVVEHFGELSPRYRWSGQVIEPADGLPYIGGSGPVYVATGYAGQGMTFGTAGGMILADLITGKPNEWADLFSPSRIHLRGAVRDLVAENVDFPRHLAADRLTKADVGAGSLIAVKPGEGKIVSAGRRKVAAFRDASGRLHALSPVCTHLKCDVAWNDAEKSWDCPCHGSRFGTDGEVLNGPAREPLERVDVSDVSEE